MCIWHVSLCPCHEKSICESRCFFQLYLPVASYIASQLYTAYAVCYCALHSLKANIISLKLKVSISLLIFQKYHSIEDGISLKITASVMYLKAKKAIRPIGWVAFFIPFCCFTNAFYYDRIYYYRLEMLK